MFYPADNLYSTLRFFLAFHPDAIADANPNALLPWNNLILNNAPRAGGRRHPTPSLHLRPMIESVFQQSIELVLRLHRLGRSSSHVSHK